MRAAEESYRYPGSHPFQDSDLDRLLFKGRETEALTLLHLVLSERLVVLFGKSGIGKSSLLNAGVFEALRERGFRPITVRLNDPDRTPAGQILDEARRHADREEHEGWGAVSVPDEPTLWEYFKRVEFWSNDDVLLTPVVVLDQFEELFTTYDEDRRRRFAVELAELVRGHAPRQLPQPTDGQPVSASAEAPPNVKVVISIREDSLADLDELTSSIPNILSCRYRLTPLALEQARKAIVEPAQARIDEIEIRAFEYEEQAVNDIVAFLSRQRTRTGYLASGEIEPFQLQLLCKHVETRVVELQKKGGGATVVVTARELGGDAGMQNIMLNFYDTQIGRLRSWRERWRVRRLFENHLIHRATLKRVSLPEEMIVERFKVPKDVLGRLIGLRLLRTDPRARSDYYELSHDTLVEPVLRSARRRAALRKTVAVLVGSVVMGFAVFQATNPPPESFERGNQFLQAGDYEAAISDFRAAIARGDSSPYVFASLGDALFEGGKYSDAFDYYRRAASRDSTLRLKFADQGGRLTELKRYGESVRYLSEAIRLDSMDAAAHNRLGVALFELRRDQEALPHLRRAVALDSTNATAYSNMGRILIELGFLQDGLSACLTAIEVDSTNAYAYYTLGLIYNAFEQYADALPHLTRAVQLDTAYARAFDQRGVALEGLHRRREAIDQYRRAIQLDSSYAEAYVNLGEALNWLDDYNQAIAYLTRAIRLDSTNVQAYNSLGFALARSGKYREAIGYLDRAIALRKDIANPYNHRGFSRLKLNELPGALADFQTALRLNPNYGAAHAGLACYHASQGSTQEAFRSLRRARELGYNDFPWMRRESCFASLRGDPRFEQLLAGPVRG
ncbi:MAG: tetratricopeptide repeat protein [Longimicrobiaceae bacterium]